MFKLLAASAVDAVLDLNEIVSIIGMIGGIDMAAVIKILAVGLSGGCTVVHDGLVRFKPRSKDLISRPLFSA